jgi:hypothetical protein
MAALRDARKSLDELLAMAVGPEEPTALTDIAECNLICAAGLRGSQELDIDAALDRIDAMAYHVDAEIRRNYHRFLANPAEAQHSQAKYCILMLVTVLQQDFGVKYNPERIRNPDFRDAGDLFIHGMLGGKGGTCASMPVLYTAVGRRLGWPLRLVHALGHVFCRWDDPEGRHPFGRERFNLEATGQGANFFTDDYYRTWPAPLSDDLIEKYGYLKSLTPANELASFLVLRGHCLEDNGQIAKACEVYKASCRWAPADPLYRAFWEHAELVYQWLIEQLTLRDYFGPDVPLPFGYFPRHVLRQMASEMEQAMFHYHRQMNEIAQRGCRLRPDTGASSPFPQHSPWPWQQPPPLDVCGLPIPPGMAGMSGLPGSAMPHGVPFGVPQQAQIDVGSMPARLLRTVDPQRLAMRRQEAVSICQSLPKGISIRQPIRLQLIPPKPTKTLPTTSEKDA